MKFGIICVAAILALTGCGEYKKSSNQIEAQNQEEVSLRAVQSVGVPAINDFAEKRMMKDILELRDKSKPTTTYIVDMNGKLHKICNSIGYGLPYATQYTNPQKVVYSQHSLTTIAQADPNGLYSPQSADGTWILCVSKETGKPVPVYIEPHVIVSPIPLGE